VREKLYPGKNSFFFLMRKSLSRAVNVSKVFFFIPSADYLQRHFTNLKKNPEAISPSPANYEITFSRKSPNPDLKELLCSERRSEEKTGYQNHILTRVF
jgi:hypothetical protein